MDQDATSPEGFIDEWFMGLYPRRYLVTPSEAESNIQSLHVVLDQHRVWRFDDIKPPASFPTTKAPPLLSTRNTQTHTTFS